MTSTNLLTNIVTHLFAHFITYVQIYLFEKQNINIRRNLKETRKMEIPTYGSEI